MLANGTIFQDRYEILDFLGEGGMGAVYKVRQIDADRVMALKLLHAVQVGDEESLKRFYREAKALSRLQHPNIVTFYHFGVSDERVPYAGLEYLRGKTLNQVLQEEQHLSAARSINIMRQLCAALGFAHELGIVHRDIKPGNVILLDSPEPDSVKVIDFGLAKLAENSGLASAKLTKTGLLIGSIHYMSPEHARGMQVDARSDVYSCGCVMFEMITGQKPFEADNAMGLLYKHSHDSVPLFSSTVYGKNCSAQIESVCRKAMEKDPQNRYQNMQEFLNDLIVLETGQGNLLARSEADDLTPGSGGGLLNRIKSLNRTLVVLALFTAATLIGSACLFISKYNSSQGLKSFTAEDKRSRQIAKMKTKPNKNLRELFALGRTELGSPLKQDLADAENRYSEALELCKLNGSHSESRAACFALRAKAEWMQGKMAASQADFDEAIRIATKIMPNSEMLKDIYLERTRLLILEKKYAQALSDFNVGTSSYEKFNNLTLPERISNVDEVVNQRLDRFGDSRVQLVRNIASDLKNEMPQSDADIAAVVRINNRTAKIMQLIVIDSLESRNAVLPIMQYSAHLISKVKGYEDLKRQTAEDLAEEKKYLLRDLGLPAQQH